jgi:hypothetical protein
MEAAVGLDIHEQLRAYLLDVHGQQPPAAIMLALMYELVSLIASAAETETEAIDVLRRGCSLGEEQIQEFGVGSPHP